MAEERILKSERRKYSRLKDNVFIFSNLTSSPTKEFKAFTLDISAGGLMFETEKALPQDMRLDLEIYQPRDRRKSVIFSIPVLAKIVWKKEVEKEDFQQGENRHRIGIEFLELKEEDRKRIAKYVKEGI